MRHSAIIINDSKGFSEFQNDNMLCDIVFGGDYMLNLQKSYICHSFFPRYLRGEGVPSSPSFPVLLKDPSLRFIKTKVKHGLQIAW